MRDEFAVLADPNIPILKLTALLQIAECLKVAFLTADEAHRAAARISTKFEGIFEPAAPPENTARSAALVIDAIEVVLRLRAKNSGTEDQSGPH
jgi:hypothetical protein